MTKSPSRVRYITAAIRAYAAGDALGVPWEGTPPAEIGTQALVPIRARDDWPLGATSDDTAQLLLIAEALVADDPAADFMRRLSDEAEAIRGMGPSSLAAIERYRRDGSLLATGGATNGALMRAPAIGWAARDDGELQALVEATTRTTHGDPRAVAAALEVARLARAVAGGASVSAPNWSPPADGVSMDATESARAVRYVLSQATSVADAAERAVRLGGDTDTIAAISAGILAAHPAHVSDEIPWLEEVLLPAPERVNRIARSLAARAAELEGWSSSAT